MKVVESSRIGNKFQEMFPVDEVGRQKLRKDNLY